MRDLTSPLAQFICYEDNETHPALFNHTRIPPIWLIESKYQVHLNNLHSRVSRFKKLSLLAICRTAIQHLTNTQHLVRTLSNLNLMVTSTVSHKHPFKTSERRNNRANTISERLFRHVKTGVHLFLSPHHTLSAFSMKLSSHMHVVCLTPTSLTYSVYVSQLHHRSFLTHPPSNFGSFNC